MNTDWVISRLSEPSTWSGLAAIAGGAALFGLSAGTWTAVAAAGMAIFGVVSAVKKDKGW